MSESPSPARCFSRLTDAQALETYSDLSIHELGRRAFERTQVLHPEPYRTYVVDRNINYANVCTARCIFCNFYRPPGHEEAYILTYEQIAQKIEELLAIGGTQVLMQGGLVPDEKHPSGQGLPFRWYLDLLRYIKKNYPTIHVHAFSPPEIWAFHRVFNMPLRDVLLRLQEAGLDTIPGGGGEILVDRVRRKIGRGKTLTDQWLAVMRTAHQLGMKTSCTMMFGHIETIAERIEHLRRLRDLQDETGGFTAFIHWPFQPEGTPLGRWKTQESDEATLRDGSGQARRRSDEGNVAAGLRPGRADRLETGPTANVAAGPRTVRSLAEGAKDSSAGPPSPAQAGAWSAARTEEPRASARAAAGPAGVSQRLPDGEHLFLADAHEYLKMLALARLYLDNIPNIQSSWVTMGPKIGQLALFYGANDMGSVMMEENVVSAAGTTFRLNEDQIRHLITDARWTPQQRDQYYRPVDRQRRAPAPVGRSDSAQQDQS